MFIKKEKIEEINKNIDLLNKENKKYQKKLIEIEEKLNEEKKHNYIVERELMKTYKVFEYKYCQHNMALNEILYNYELEMKKNKSINNNNINPLISIIIPVYNGSEFLDYAIKSALGQTYTNFEIIVVNDGSNDKGKTEAVAKKYGDKIRYYKKENGGVSTALNYGIKKMKGDYFCWLSHDDLFYPNHLEEHINYIKYASDENTITYTNFDIIDESGQLKLNETIIELLHISDYKLSKTSHYACLLQGEINGGNVMIPRIAFKECGMFEEGNKITQEKEMWSRLLKKYSFVNIPKITYSIRSHSKQITQNDSNISKETNKKLLEIINNIPEKEMIKESKNVENFYLLLYQHYINNNLIEMANEMMRKYKNSIKKH